MNGFSAMAFLPAVNKFSFLQSRIPKSSFQVAMEAVTRNPVVDIFQKAAAAFESPAMKVMRTMPVMAGEGVNHA